MNTLAHLYPSCGSVAPGRETHFVICNALTTLKGKRLVLGGEKVAHGNDWVDIVGHLRSPFISPKLHLLAARRLSLIMLIREKS